MANKPNLATIADAQVFFHNSGFRPMLDENLHSALVEYLYRNSDGEKTGTRLFADFLESQGFDSNEWDLDFSDEIEYIVWFSASNNPSDDYAEGGAQYDNLNDAIVWAQLNANTGVRERKWIIVRGDNVVATSEMPVEEIQRV